MAEQKESRDAVQGSGVRPVALITGTSSGFGLLTALTLARRGYQVVATMRDLERRHELEEKAVSEGVADRIRCLRLDVTEHSAIGPAMDEIVRRYGRLDLLVNNAGLAVGGFVEEVPMEEWRRQMETNLFGVIAVTRAVLPTMRAQRRGMVINISSVSGLSGFPGYAPYAASKFAVEGFSESLRHEMRPFAVRVVLVEPGAYRTPIWSKGIGGIRTSQSSPYRTQLEAVLRYSRKAAETAPDPQEVADLIARIAGMRTPRLRYALGQGSRLLICAKALLPWKWLERIVDKALS